MKWFKHYSDASDDQFIEELEDKFGWEGYGRWWKLLEIISKGMEKNNEPYAEHSWVKWQSFLKGKQNKLDLFLVHCQDKSKLKLEQNGNILRIICPKLLELRDNHTKNLQVSGKLLAPKTKTKDLDNIVLNAGAPVPNLVEEIFDWLTARFNSPSRFYITAPITAWLGWGADFELDVKPVAERFIAQGKEAPPSLTWLDDGIAASIKQRNKPMPEKTQGGEVKNRTFGIPAFDQQAAAREVFHG